MCIFGQSAYFVLVFHSAQCTGNARLVERCEVVEKSHIFVYHIAIIITYRSLIELDTKGQDLALSIWHHYIQWLHAFLKMKRLSSSFFHSDVINIPLNFLFKHFYFQSLLNFMVDKDKNVVILSESPPQRKRKSTRLSLKPSKKKATEFERASPTLPPRSPSTSLWIIIWSPANIIHVALKVFCDKCQ